MAVQNVGDVISVIFSGSWHAQRIVSTFYYKVGAVVGAPTTTAFSAALIAEMRLVGRLVAKFKAACPPAYNLDEIWAQTVSPVRVVRDVVVVAEPGTNINDSNTANTASVITRKGDFANRHNIGSLHVPLPNKDLAIFNGINSAFQFAILQTLAAEMLLNVNAGALGATVPVLWHPPLTTNSTAITRTQVQATVRVMRRRTVGVGK